MGTYLNHLEHICTCLFSEYIVVYFSTQWYKLEHVYTQLGMCVLRGIFW